MTSIYKYLLKITDVQTIDLPRGAIILDVQFQDDQLCLWAWVDVAAVTSPKKIRIVGTGHRAASGLLAQYLATVQQKVDGSNLVWHVFAQE